MEMDLPCSITPHRVIWGSQKTESSYIRTSEVECDLDVPCPRGIGQEIQPLGATMPKCVYYQSDESRPH